MASRPPDILVEIVAQRRRRLRAQSGQAPREETPGTAPPLAVDENPLLAALAARSGRAVIAEIKMGSPRLGSLADRVDPLTMARLYGSSGAAALSVVVEPDFFCGSYELLARCKVEAGLPALAKDFLVDPLQLQWAAEAGADAVLLVAALYGRRELAGWAQRARGFGLAPLVEIHGSVDLAKLAGRSWEMVGVNNRDLRTFRVSIEHAIRQCPRLPAGTLKVAESGISAASQLSRLAVAGFDAFLIGESLLLAEDPSAKLAELIG